jgi:NitT/TauT family transport system substrate-binding protein
MHVRGWIALLFLGLTAASLGPAAAAAPQPIVVRYASVGGTTDAALYIGMDYGLFRDAGIDFRYRRLDSAAALLGAIATDQLDVAGISLTPGLFASLQRGVQLRVVGDKESILPDFAATQLLARPDLATGTTAQMMQRLRGKTIAVSGRTSVSYFLLGTLLKKYGMTTRDVRVVELAYPAQIAAFPNRAIDAGVMLEPFLSQAIANGDAKPVSDFTEIVPPVGGSIVPIIYSEKFAANRRAGDAFMLAYMKAVHIYTDAYKKNIGKERVITTLAKHTGFAPEIIRSGNPVGFSPNQEVSAAFFDSAQRFHIEQGFLREPIDVRRLLDPSFARAAVRVLGEYR